MMKYVNYWFREVYENKYLNLIYKYYKCQILGARMNVLNNDKKAPVDLTMDPRCKALLDYKCDKNVSLAQNSEYLDEVDDGNNSD